MSKTRKLVIAALLVALDIIFTRFFAITIPTVERFSFQFIPHALSGLLLGPIWSVLTLIGGDLLGMVVNSQGQAFFPGFTLSAALRGLIYGLMLYKRPFTFLRTLCTVAAVQISIDLLLNSVWMNMYYGQAYEVFFKAKILVRLAYIPIAATVLFLVGKALLRILQPDLLTKKETGSS